MKYTLVIRSADRLTGTPSNFQAPVDFQFSQKYRLWEATLIHATFFKSDGSGVQDKLLEVTSDWNQPTSYDSRTRGNNKALAFVNAVDLSTGVDGDNQGIAGTQAFPVVITTPANNLVNIKVVESGTDAWPTGTTESESVFVFSISPVKEGEDEE